MLENETSVEKNKAERWRKRERERKKRKEGEREIISDGPDVFDPKSIFGLLCQDFVFFP